jgi:nucleoside-diphosphate kinase
MEKTLIVLKPDAVKRGLCGEILARFERRGFEIVAMKSLTVSPELAQQHYAEHSKNRFSRGLVEFITGAPSIAMVLQALMPLRFRGR